MAIHISVYYIQISRQKREFDHSSFYLIGILTESWIFSPGTSSSILSNDSSTISFLAVGPLSLSAAISCCTTSTSLTSFCPLGGIYFEPSLNFIAMNPSSPRTTVERTLITTIETGLCYCLLSSTLRISFPSGSFSTLSTLKLVM